MFGGYQIMLSYWDWIFENILNTSTMNFITSHYIFSSFIISSVIFIYILKRPFNFVKELSAVGYEHLAEDQSLKKRGICKRKAVEMSAQSRTLGNLPPVYPNGWFSLAESSDVKIGQIKHVAALGENFAIFRGTSGEIHVTDAYCPHLGANLAIGGVVIDDCVRCPFHGWVFDGQNGKCVEIPNTSAINARVKVWTSCEVNTLIMIWYHAEDEPPSWHPEPIKCVDTWWYRGRTEHYVSAHIQEMPENGADLTHLAVLHGPAIFFGCDLRKINNRLKIVNHYWSGVWEAYKEEGKDHMARLTVETGTTFFRYPAFHMHVETDQIGPGYVVLNMSTYFGPMLMIQTVTPVGPTTQKVVHKLFYPPKMVIMGSVVFFTFSCLFERDVAVWNHKKYHDKPPLTKEEITITKFRKWYTQFYSENSPRLRARESLDW